MLKFELQEKELSIRGEKVIVRELTHGERMDYLEHAKDAKAIAGWVVSVCCIEPKLSADDAGALPGDIAQQIFSAILDISGLTTRSAASGDRA